VPRSRVNRGPDTEARKQRRCPLDLDKRAYEPVETWSG
jgi:hypothetical protein